MSDFQRPRPTAESARACAVVIGIHFREPELFRSALALDFAAVQHNLLCTTGNRFQNAFELYYIIYRRMDFIIYFVILNLLET